MNVQQIKVSVCIPVFNAAVYIGDCVDILWSQAIDSLELIFVDDGSTDHSIDILETKIAECKAKQTDFAIRREVKILRLPENKGVACARRTAVLNATGQYIIHFDSDDWCEPTMYKDLYDRAVAEGAAIVLCDALQIKMDGSRNVMSQYLPEYTPETTIESMLLVKKHRCLPSLWCKLVRADLAKTAFRDLPDNIHTAEDFRMSIVMFKICNEKIGYIGYPYYHYMRRENSITSSLSLRKFYTCMLDNIIYFDDVLDPQKKRALFNRKCELLFAVIAYNLLSTQEYRYLFPNAKKDFLSSHLTITSKLFVFLSLLSYPLAVHCYRVIPSLRSILRKIIQKVRAAKNELIS